MMSQLAIIVNTTLLAAAAAAAITVPYIVNRRKAKTKKVRVRARRTQQPSDKR